ncbi:RNA pseudouridine synthase [Altericroceibacterium spongiae]|uniref:RNA pseudouridine synthase n=1 Tax=Altericroceibacterium spongiae TaxID=2320269 RepID=A0A420EPC1_9SPHN|nr:RNA pseudouridine synthase [Altericroceibacterium spongiae]RKF22528.1 RNA pseudouridine synthase [Altericroceibacterium spongiae]
MSTIPILFEDAEALVIDKPAGLPVERPRSGKVSLEDYLDSLKLGFQRSPVAVHRIDTDTSGCLLLARNPKALKRFARSFEEKLVSKRYLGVIAGVLEEEEGTIALSLSKVSTPKQGWRIIPAKKGKPSVTHWRRLAEANGRTFVEFLPETGRTHQIRVHAASGLGAPLLGDPVYGGRDSQASRMMLHASRLSLPREGKEAIEALSPLPEAFRDLGFSDE